MERICWMLATVLIWAANAALSKAATPAPVTSAGWPGRQYIITVGETGGWNIPSSDTFFNDWVLRRMANPAIGNMLVFRSNPGSNSTVVVFTTTDKSRTQDSICQDKSLVGSHGTNHFTTGVSLVLLKSGVTYWFLSGYPGECVAGLVFHVTMPERDVIYDYSTLNRDVGVAYIVSYNDTSGAHVASFGSYIQPQAATFDNSSASATKYFIGDALNIEFHGYNRLFVQSNSGSGASCSSYQEQFVFGPSGNDPLFVSVFLGGNQSTEFRNFYSLTLSATLNCGQGITIADVSIQNKTSSEICRNNPGPPYICSNARKRATFPGGICIVVALIVLLLVA